MTLPYDAEFFQRLAQMSEEALLAGAEALAQRRDLAGLTGLLRHMAETRSEGINYGIIDKWPAKGLNRELPPAGSFPRALITALAIADFGVHTPKPMISRARKLTDSESSYLDQLIAVASCHRFAQSYLDSLLHEAAALVSSPEVALRLIKGGASPKATKASMQAPVSAHGSREQTTPLQEAFLAGNTAMANALTRVESDENVSAIVDRIYKGMPVAAMLQRQELAALTLAALDTEGMLAPGGGAELLDTLETRVSPAQMLELRRAWLKQYLGFSPTKAAHQWDLGVVTAIAAKSGEQLSDSAVMTSVRDCTVGRPGTAARELLAAAVRAHCHPILEASGEAIAIGAAGSIPEGCAMHCALETAHQITSNQDKTRLRQTLLALKDRGLPHNGTSREDGTIRHRPLLLELSKTAHQHPDWKERLVVLVGIGCDPKQKDSRGWTAASHLQEEALRRDWEYVVRTYSAHDAARRLLESGSKAHVLTFAR